MIVLDEPNASLDESGEKALLAMLLACKKRGATVVVITHRTTLMSAVDKLMVMAEGKTMMFGPRDEVQAALKKANEEARAKLAAQAIRPPSKHPALGQATIPRGAA